jgi:hypothetical protein
MRTAPTEIAEMLVIRGWTPLALKPLAGKIALR